MRIQQAVQSGLTAWAHCVSCFHTCRHHLDAKGGAARTWGVGPNSAVPPCSHTRARALQVCWAACIPLCLAWINSETLLLGLGQQPEISKMAARWEWLFHSLTDWTGRLIGPCGPRGCTHSRLFVRACAPAVCTRMRCSVHEARQAAVERQDGQGLQGARS